MPRRAAYKAVRLRWLVVARLESANLNPNQIAGCTGFSNKTVARILDNAQYQEWRDARINDGVSAIDHIISQDAQEMRTSLRELVPAAIRVLENGLQSPKEEIRLRSAVEILDRDDRFSKAAQQVNHTHTLIGPADLARAREIASELRPALPVVQELSTSNCIDIPVSVATSTEPVPTPSA